MSLSSSLPLVQVENGLRKGSSPETAPLRGHSGLRKVESWEIESDEMERNIDEAEKLLECFGWTNFPESGVRSPESGVWTLAWLSTLNSGQSGLRTPDSGLALVNL